MKSQISYAKFQSRYGGQFIARKGSRVLASADTYGRLTRKVRQMRLERKSLSFGYVPPKQIVCIYEW